MEIASLDMMMESHTRSDVSSIAPILFIRLEERRFPSAWSIVHFQRHFLKRFFKTSSRYAQFSKTRDDRVDVSRILPSQFREETGIERRSQRLEWVDLSRSIFLANAGLHINWKLKAGILWDIVKDWSAHFRANPRRKCIWTECF